MPQILKCATIPLSGTTLPTELLLFRRGVNRTVHGDFVLTDESARAIVAEFAARGVPCTIDLEHMSLSPEARAARADACDSMGSGYPEVRADGSLWLSNVKWSVAGERRLRDRTQRFISPAALYNRDTRRITGLVNAALVADPATYDAPALIAASRTGVIAARLPADTAAAFRSVAACRGVTVSALVQLAIGHMLAPFELQKSAILDQLCRALGLTNPTKNELKAALELLIEANAPAAKAPAPEPAKLSAKRKDPLAEIQAARRAKYGAR